MNDRWVKQSNNFTTSRYDVTPLQKNLLYKLVEARHSLVTSDISNKEMLFAMKEVIEIDVESIAKGSDYRNIVKAAEEITIKTFKYQYEDSKQREVSGYSTIISGAEHPRGTTKIRVALTGWGIAFLDYVGKGFTPMYTTVAYALKSKYSKRIFDFVSRWADKGGKEYDLYELCDLLQLPKTFYYPKSGNIHITKLKNKVLDVAKKEIKEHCPHFWFDYSFDKPRNPQKIIIKVHHLSKQNLDKSKKTIDTSDYFGKCYNWLSVCFNIELNSTFKDLLDELARDKTINKLYNKLERLRNQHKDNEHFSRVVTKMLREDYVMEITKDLIRF